MNRAGQCPGTTVARLLCACLTWSGASPRTPLRSAALRSTPEPSYTPSREDRELDPRRRASVRVKPKAGRLTKDQIRGLVERLGDVREVLPDTDPIRKREVYRQLQPQAIYYPGKRPVRIEANLGSHVCEVVADVGGRTPRRRRGTNRGFAGEPFTSSLYDRNPGRTV